MDLIDQTKMFGMFEEMWLLIICKKYSVNKCLNWMLEQSQEILIVIVMELYIKST